MTNGEEKTAGTVLCRHRNGFGALKRDMFRGPIWLVKAVAVIFLADGL